jgi:hypothetical protein
MAGEDIPARMGDSTIALILLWRVQEVAWVERSETQVSLSLIRLHS